MEDEFGCEPGQESAECAEGTCEQEKPKDYKQDPRDNLQGR